ncbi:MAG: type I restriction-modification system subunit M N-terminal domain-containing protein, partial [Mucispirillum sp.]|nr:type I restriction-modification system subunit M N-terminal domain-containing protein [Mucispirillum sp.]
MVTGELKNKIDDIWNAFWSGGITNPLTVVEQLTYLMFIHDIGETDDMKLSMSRRFNFSYESKFIGEDEKEIDGKKVIFSRKDYKWSSLLQQNAETQYNLMVYGIFP